MTIIYSIAYLASLGATAAAVKHERWHGAGVGIIALIAFGIALGNSF